ncbi:hypothetical protein BVG79_01981 [Ketogulonicigenium robustum]|uniref:Uncharacterized protein n=1 Tax=Ketogulonicigenium robustum TaxID=92947 RepID=A0A1W6P1M6_9RHOB|nr:hypothetical protein BVG79_01981 [Ketogulonicigenium robustum]
MDAICFRSVFKCFLKSTTSCKYELFQMLVGDSLSGVVWDLH